MGTRVIQFKGITLLDHLNQLGSIHAQPFNTWEASNQINIYPVVAFTSELSSHKCVFF